MTTAYIIPEENIKKALEYFKDLDIGSTDPTLREEDRQENFQMWRGFHRALRKLGIDHIELEEKYGI